MVLLVALLGFLGLAAPSGETCAATARCAEACGAPKDNKDSKDSKDSKDPKDPKDIKDVLEACVARCAARAEPTTARPLFEALQKCSRPACAPRCVEPASLTCRMCVMTSCSTEVANCMSH